MLQIALLLLGSSFVKRTLPYLLPLSLLWGFTGMAIFIDGLDGVIFDGFCYFILLESITTLMITPTVIGFQRNIILVKGAIFLCGAIVALINVKSSNILLSLAFGLVYFAVGIFNISSAFVVRFSHWKKAILWGFVQIGYSLFLLMNNDYVISYVLGFIMITASVKSIYFLFRVYFSKNNSAIYPLLNNNTNVNSLNTLAGSQRTHHDLPLTIHIWTPEGSAENPYIPRPIINRYIAATDITGVISTGHAAVEVGKDLYISLYPKDEIERSPSEFINTLKAIPENNVAGRYLPDYQSEVAEWCESNIQIQFSKYNRHTLEQFWQQNSSKPIYNLTSNNCSSNTAYALEAALDSVLHDNNPSMLTLIKLMIKPELWLAAQIRHRAIMMAWTPGLTMDYSRTLQTIVHPITVPWYQCNLLQKLPLRHLKSAILRH